MVSREAMEEHQAAICQRPPCPSGESDQEDFVGPDLAEDCIKVLGDTEKQARALLIELKSKVSDENKFNRKCLAAG